MKKLLTPTNIGIGVGVLAVGSYFLLQSGEANAAAITDGGGGGGSSAAPAAPTSPAEPVIPPPADHDSINWVKWETQKIGRAARQANSFVPDGTYAGWVNYTLQRGNGVTTRQYGYVQRLLAAYPGMGYKAMWEEAVRLGYMQKKFGGYVWTVNAAAL